MLKFYFIPLFVKKGNDEGTEFYFIARVRPEKNSFKEEIMPSGDDTESGPPVVSMILNLDQPVDEGLYSYLHEKTPE